MRTNKMRTAHSTQRNLNSSPNLDINPNLDFNPNQNLDPNPDPNLSVSLP